MLCMVLIHTKSVGWMNESKDNRERGCMDSTEVTTYENPFLVRLQPVAQSFVIL